MQGIAYLGVGQDLYELGKWEMAGDAYQAELGQAVRTIETKSELAQTLLALKQTGTALTLVNERLDISRRIRCKAPANRFGSI